jgi:DNA-binding transcriptional ArsR family regulator
MVAMNIATFRLSCAVVVRARRRPLSGAPEIRIAASESLELLAGLWAWLDHDHRPSYDIGGPWFRAMTDALGPEAETLAAFLGGSTLAWDHVIGLAAMQAGDVDGFLRHLAAMPPGELRGALLGVRDGILTRTVPAALLDAAAGGDADAVRRVRRLTARQGTGWLIALRQLTEGDATALRDELVRLLGAWRAAMAEVGGMPGGELRASEAARGATLLERGDPATVAATLLGDIPLRTAPETRDVLLVPSLIVRPFTFYVEHGGRMVFIYPVPATDAEPMPGRARLVAMARALGDPMRVDLLADLRGGERTLRELMECTGWPRSTLRHHLDLLVEAGLARRTPGYAGRYALREEGAVDLADMVRRFAGS